MTNYVQDVITLPYFLLAHEAPWEKKKQKGGWERQGKSNKPRRRKGWARKGKKQRTGLASCVAASARVCMPITSFHQVFVPFAISLTSGFVCIVCFVCLLKCSLPFCYLCCWYPWNIVQGSNSCFLLKWMYMGRQRGLSIVKEEVRVKASCCSQSPSSAFLSRNEQMVHLRQGQGRKANTKTKRQTFRHG